MTESVSHLDDGSLFSLPFMSTALVLLATSLILTNRMSAGMTLTGNVIPGWSSMGLRSSSPPSGRRPSRYALAQDDADRADQARKLVFFRQGLERDLSATSRSSW